MMKTAPLATLAGFALVIAACASAATRESEPMPPETATSNAPSARGSEAAADLSGTWAFDLESSDVARGLRERCAAEAAGAPEKQAACWDALKAEAKLEKIRFSKVDDAGRATWTSFAVDGAEESVFLEAAIVLSSDGPGHLVARIAGSPTGAHAERFANAKVDAMRIERIDARTIALSDPKSGRLVYSKE